MKKLLFFILIFTNIYAYSQTIKFTNQVRQTKSGGVYRLQIDSNFDNNWRNFATESYVQGYVAAHGGSFSQGTGIGISPTGVISLTSISGFIGQGANVTITGSGTAANPYIIASTGAGGAGANANVGSGYRWAVANTQNVKTFANGYGLVLDSLTANTITAKIDSNLFSSKAYRQKGIDSINNLLIGYTPTSTLSANYVLKTTTVGTGFGLLGGGPLDASRTHFIDSSAIETKAAAQNLYNQAIIGKSPTFVVAASNAPTNIKSRADYVCDGTNDEVEINTALALGNVQLTEGTFNISTTGIQMASNRSLSGQGDGTVLLAISYTTTSKMITATGTQGITLRNFEIDGASHTMGYGVYFELVGSGSGDAAITGCSINGLYIKNAYQSAIELQSCRNSIITNTRIASPNWDGIVLKKKTGQTKGCVNVTISNTIQNNATAAVWGQFAEYSNIVNNIFEGDSTNGRGQELIQLEGSTYINITGNTIRNSAENNININDICSNIVIDGNTIDKTYTAEGIYCLAPNSVISNNIVTNSAHDGIYFEGTNVTVSGNRIFGNSTISNNTYSGIASAFSSDCNVFGNTISKGTNTNKQKYGITITSATRPLVSGNNLYDSGLTGDYNTNSTTSRNRSNLALDGTWRDLLYTNAQYEMNTGKLLGRSTASQGKAEEINIGSGLNLSGGTLSATATAPIIVVALTDGATINTDASAGFIAGATYRVTLAGNRTIANPTGMVDGQRIVYEIKQDATGSRTVTWGSKFTWSNDVPVVTLSTTAGYVDFVSWVYNASADKFYVTGANIGVH